MHYSAQDTKNFWCLQWQPVLTTPSISLVPLSICLQIILHHRKQNNILEVCIQSCFLLLLYSLQRFLIALSINHANPEPVLWGCIWTRLCYLYDLLSYHFLIGLSINRPFLLARNALLIIFWQLCLYLSLRFLLIFTSLKRSFMITNLNYVSPAIFIF